LWSKPWKNKTSNAALVIWKSGGPHDVHMEQYFASMWSWGQTKKTLYPNIKIRPYLAIKTMTPSISSPLVSISLSPSPSFFFLVVSAPSMPFYCATGRTDLNEIQTKLNTSRQKYGLQPWRPMRIKRIISEMHANNQTLFWWS
jgi:hypothetical protein